MTISNLITILETEQFEHDFYDLTTISLLIEDSGIRIDYEGDTIDGERYLNSINSIYCGDIEIEFSDTQAGAIRELLTSDGWL